MQGDTMDVANHSVVLLQQLNVQREFGFLCDCTVAVGDIHFKAHRAVLAAFSNYFKMIFIHQSSDYIKVQPVDIQPDIFSYLLHLMYTGKGPKQPVDPNRLEEGIRFLHAYNLVHDPGHGGQVFAQHHEVLPLQSPNLYGIQISGSQKLQVRDLQPPGGRSGAAAQTLEQPCQASLGAATNIPEHRYARPPIGQESVAGTEDSGQSFPPAASRGLLSGGLQVPGLNFKRGKSHKLYSCHYCGERFAARGSLRDHLYSHASGALPSGASAECRGPGEPQEVEKPEGLPPQGSESLLPASDQPEGGSLDEQPPVGLTVTIGAYGDPVDSGGNFGAAKRRKFACSVCGHSAEPDPGATSPPSAAPPAGPEEPSVAPQRPEEEEEEGEEEELMVTSSPTPGAPPPAELERAFRQVFAGYEAPRVHAHYKCARVGCERTSSSSSAAVSEARRGDRFVHKWLSDRELTYCERTGVYWLLYEEGQGMFCYLCRRHDTHNKQNKTKVFNGTPAVRYKKSALQVHAESQQHAAAVHAELAGRMSAREMAERERQEAAALRALFLAAYWLAREGLPTAKLRPALRLLAEAGLAGGAATHFRRADTLQEVFRGLGRAVRRRLLGRLRRAAAYGLRCERAGPGAEATLLVFVQFVEPGTAEVASGLLFAEAAPVTGRAWDSAEELAALIGRALGRLELPAGRLAWLVTDGGEVMPAAAARLRERSPVLLGLPWVCRRLLLAAAPGCRRLLRVEAWLQQLWEALERSPGLAEAYLSARLASQPSRRLRPPLLRRLRRACRRRRLSLEASVEGAYHEYPALLRALAAAGEAEAAAGGLLSRLGDPRFAGALYILREASASLLGLSRAWRRGSLQPPGLEPALRQALQRLEEAAASRAPLARLRADLEPGGRLACCGLPALEAGDEAELSGLLEAYTAGLAADLRRRFGASGPLLAAFSVFNPLLVPEPGSAAFPAHGQAEVGALAAHYHPGDPEAEARLQAEWARLRLQLPGWRDEVPADGGASATEWCLRRLLGHGSYPGLAPLAEASLSAPVGPGPWDRAFAALRRLEARLRGGRGEEAGLLDSLLHVSVNGPELGTADCGQLVQEAALAFLQQRRRRGRGSPPRDEPSPASGKAEEAAAEGCCSEGSEQELEQLQQELDQTVGALQLQADNESDSEDSLCD
ncbi:LOW QUALITY PROTEIN: uncharacterized protein LOC127571324 [Pristis pectinata]|uniref:LOW QUALITY PROTEIN: uncharacterized protein LOC127571324 n=1 Tax=Pristis pectinata TaxID=685728 RepID=UPI00223C98CA|nr:LOW QUALITY PROTEIN: uncharacterized protein LOC127571324 [Pristis pectinata]